MCSSSAAAPATHRALPAWSMAWILTRQSPASKASSAASAQLPARISWHRRWRSIKRTWNRNFWGDSFTPVGIMKNRLRTPTWKHLEFWIRNSWMVAGGGIYVIAFFILFRVANINLVTLSPFRISRRIRWFWFPLFLS